MTRPSIAATLLIATRNAHKAGEIRAILGDRFRYQTLQDFPGAPEVIEDAASFSGNATKKALELARWLAAIRNPKPQTPVPSSQLPDPKPQTPDPSFYVLADDSGLEVDALDGAPGVYSARFAALETGQAGNSSDADNNARLLHLLKEVPLERRTARFRCVLALVERAGAGAARDPLKGEEPSAMVKLFEGTCAGRIDFAPRGEGGFGYDPLFVPDGFQQSFAEIGAAIKNRLSHRSKALVQLKAALDA